MREQAKLGKYSRECYWGWNKNIMTLRMAFSMSSRKVKEIIVVGADLVSDRRYAAQVIINL